MTTHPAPVRPFPGPDRHVALAACGGTDLVPFEVAHPMWPTAARPWGGFGPEGRGRITARFLCTADLIGGAR